MCDDLYTTSVMRVTDAAPTGAYGRDMTTQRNRRKKGIRRIVIGLAFASLAAGASATTASPSICLCDDGGATVERYATPQGAPALHKVVPAKAAKKPRTTRR